MFSMALFGSSLLSSPLLSSPLLSHSSLPLSQLLMFSMALFGSSQPLLSPRSSEMLMSELGSLLRRSERLQLERAAEGRRRRSSVDYTWLAVTPKPAYQLSPGETLELQDLCAKIQPSQCGPVILRFRKLVMEYEPDVHEVSRIFRSVLCDSLDEERGREEERQLEQRGWDKQRSKSLSVMTFKSRLRINPSRNPAPSGSTLDEDSDEEAGLGGGARRVRSMPEITPCEQTRGP
ncbi:protein RD3-like isoform X2 [Acipenser ruthenus]|uniref:protein RD3-like isoform X2 n=1 Tax=Acipenser ruthenus TaxID=7906 RepID=UPI002740B98D|nr:protein RD3-like isoform X2 [Acipenser ruthenus]XP_058876646.1 protein RD3-like isoform X2 [Acipenser ruthenus]